MPTANTKENGSHPDGMIPTPIVPDTADAASRSRPEFVIHAPKIRIITIPIVGTSPLVTHPYSQKLLKQWEEDRSRDNEVGEKPAGTRGEKKALPPRNYEQEYQNSIYHLDGGEGCGMKAIAFKRALVDACKLVGKIEAWQANMVLFVHGRYRSGGYPCVKIIGEPHPRRDTVKLQGQGRNKPPDNRFRAEFDPWEAELEIEFDTAFMSIKSIHNLVVRAGYSCGVGEMRPTSPYKPDDFGKWRLKTPEEIAMSEVQATAPSKRKKKGS
jgi:hypothetical protein